MTNTNGQPERGKVSDAFIFWTNKGGVGKTTMCFHSATAFAATHPNAQVTVIDCDQQANLSQTILTQLRTEPDGQDKEGHVNLRTFEQEKIKGDIPRTVLGFFIDYNNREGKPLEPKDLIIKTHEYNSNLPKNLKLLCGDRRLSCSEPELQSRASTVVTPMRNPWTKTRLALRQFLEDAAEEHKEGETVLFLHEPHDELIH